MPKSVMLLAALMAAVLLFAWQHWPEPSGDQLRELRAEVLAVDDARLITQGQARIGSQQLTVKIDSGPWAGHELDGVPNHFSGSMEFDEYYAPGDRVLLAVRQLPDGRLQGRVVARDRLLPLATLFGVFAGCLLLYAGRIGLRSLFSFVGSVLILWQWLIPRLLTGNLPLLWTGVCVLALILLILVSVAGFSRKTLAALLGTLSGLLLTGGLAWWACDALHLDGLEQMMAQPLYFETGLRLDMRQIYCAAILIGASGAAMDVAMEMAATLEELHRLRPDLGTGQLLRSGFKVGNAVIGTMTTTLLLAYSGGFLTLLLMFWQREASLLQMLNLKLVAAELTRILVGSCALVMVAPLTAWIAAALYCGTRSRQRASRLQPEGAAAS